MCEGGVWEYCPWTTVWCNLVSKSSSAFSLESRGKNLVQEIYKLRSKKSAKLRVGQRFSDRYNYNKPNRGGYTRVLRIGLNNLFYKYVSARREGLEVTLKWYKSMSSMARREPCHLVKGTVSEFTSDPPCKEANVRLTTVHFKRLSIDINVCNFENWIWIVGSLCRKTSKKEETISSTFT